MVVYCYTDMERLLLKQLRIKKGVTQSAVADKLGVTKGYISQIELGKRPVPKYRVLIELLSIYGIQPKYFEELLTKKKYES